MSEHETIESFKQQAQVETDCLYEKLRQMEKVRDELDQFIVKEKAAEKEFGKSINEILEEYAEIVEGKSSKHLISLNSRQSGLSSHKVLMSPRSSKVMGQFSSSGLKSTREYRPSKEPGVKRESGRGESKTSSRASQEGRLQGLQSPRK